MAILKQVLVDRLGKRRDLYAWRVFQPNPRLKAGDRVCLLHLDGKLGDAVINSSIVAAFEKAHPEVEFWVGTVPGFVDYWSSHPHVTKAVCLKPPATKGGALRFLELARSARPYRGMFDFAICLDPFVQLDTFFLLRVLQPKTVVGFSKPQYGLFDYSLVDRSFEVEREHVTARIERLLRLFGIDVGYSELAKHVPTTQESDAKALELMGEPGGKGPSVLFNAYGAGKDKTFNWGSVIRILDPLIARDPELTVYLSLPRNPEDLEGFDASSLARFGNSVRTLYPAEELSALFSCLRRVDGIVTTDTAAGHIGAAMGKPMLCFFHDIAFGPIVWRPYSDLCDVVVSLGGQDVNDQDWANVPSFIAGFIGRVHDLSNKQKNAKPRPHRIPGLASDPVSGSAP